MEPESSEGAHEMIRWEKDALVDKIKNEIIDIVN